MGSAGIATFEIVCSDSFVLQEHCRITKEFCFKNGEKIILTEPLQGEEKYCLFVPTACISSLQNNANWAMLLCLDRFLVRHGRIILHASCVVDGEKATLFCAPSGGGKSTQADIWSKHFGSEILNGDKVVLALIDNKCVAFGSPIAGTSGIYRSISAYVDTVARVAKSDQNRVTPFSKRDAMLTLFSESVRFDDDRLNELLLSKIMELIAVIEVVLFECTRDTSASIALFEWINRFDR